MNANKLKAAMIEAGYSQRTLAKAMNMSKNTLNAKINGKRRIFIDEAMTMCHLLNISSDDLKEIFLL